MKIDIKEPCTANWETMKIGVTSRNCQQCNKDVIDFTSLNRAEIITYLIEHTGKSICGRIQASSIDFHETDLPILIDALRKQNSNLAFTFLAAACLCLSACTETPSPKKVQIELQSPKKTSVSPTDVSTNKSAKKEAKNKAHNSQQFVPGEHELMGEIRILPEPTTTGVPVCPPNEPDVAVPYEEKDSVYLVPTKSAEFPGGMEMLFQYIQKNMKYPELARELGTQGTVYLEFIVRKTGEIDNIKLLRGIKGGPELDKEAIRIVKKMPKWNPGSVDGRNVSSIMRLPIKFRLD